jgi:hypothetical protein
MRHDKRAVELPVELTHGMVAVDFMFFDMARKLIESYEAGLQEFKPETREYWAAAHAGASISMVCSAMEAHANYLLNEAATEGLPNFLGLSGDACEVLVNRLSSLEAKWLLTCMVLTGKQLLKSGESPFRDFCEAVRRRNNYIAHPKMRMVRLRKGGKLREFEELTIQNAKDAVAAAQQTVRLVYAELPYEPPRWAQ